jgi:UTP--glucose-1-phosphate uridylyltransferase
MNERKIRKAVIPIAGWGTRMFPATKAIPKALFPIIDIVNLQYNQKNTNKL